MDPNDYKNMLMKGSYSRLGFFIRFQKGCFMRFVAIYPQPKYTSLSVELALSCFGPWPAGSQRELIEGTEKLAS